VTVLNDKGSKWVIDCMLATNEKKSLAAIVRAIPPAEEASSSRGMIPFLWTTHAVTPQGVCLSHAAHLAASLSWLITLTKFPRGFVRIVLEG
jgi:hypothetical protein